MLRGFHLNGEQLDPSIVALRQEVRDFIAAERASGGFKVGPGLWLRFDPNFSEKLGRRGWVGMTFPKQYGGHGLSALHRYVVTEALQHLLSLGSSRPVIIISADKDGGLNAKALKAGAAGYLQKPFNDQALVDLINGAIENKKQRKAT